MDDESFHQCFAGSPIRRLKRARFLRNVCVVLGNIGSADDVPALREAAGDEDPLIREHAEWALEQLNPC